MSGKPASVGASRAGVPGAPRVLVYVDPRQLEPGAAAHDPPQPPPSTHHPHLGTVYLSDNLHPQLALPRNTLYRHTDSRNISNTVFYKSANESDTKVAVYGSENTTQRTEFYPVSQQFVKDSCLKLDERNEQTLVTKQESNEKSSNEYLGSETYQSRIPVESVDLATYQLRCSGTLGGDTMPTIQQIALRHGQNQFSESVTVHGVDGPGSDRELSVGKSYVNYQILEQSVSHQSIVNQSISILNQQVGVSRGIASEVDSGNNPQLVRTAEGVVLAVLPAPVAAQTTDNQDSSRTVSSDSPQTITVPLGWRRIVTGTSVLYLSPSGTALSTLPQLREYLQTSGTCKCGLPCPLRPETAFNFDSKVISKPYQVASGAELTKLCNHKRKLLATLQSRSQSPATPPPQNTEQKKVAGTEVAVFKKKMKRPGIQGNVNMSQLMLQRERPLSEFKHQEAELRDMSPGIGQHRGGNGQPLPNYTPQHAHNTGAHDDNVKQETQLQRSSHYLTVNNGWITQQCLEGQKDSQSISNQNPVGMPVLGNNGQIIGVNTGYNKSPNAKNMNMMPPALDSEQKEERKEISIHQNIQSIKYSHKDDDSQVFCGLNQALTPEVMQKINEQQQIFIQQNQKQIEMAMKGYKNQLQDNIHQNKPQGQYASQAQLVIQNGAVVKTNPAKTPPWQVKRNDSSNSNTITSPNPKLSKMDSTDFDEHSANLSEDSSSSFSSFSSNEQVLTTQGMCSRVPPLPQHYNMMNQQQWPAVETSKKKGKGNAKGSKKKNNTTTDTKVINFGGNGMRLMQESKNNVNEDISSNSLPSFMEDPNGYLAQQTALLNNTISRQVGMNPAYDANNFDAMNNANFGPQHQIDKMKSINKTCEVTNVFRNNVPNHSPSPNTTPDSSVLSEKTDSSVQQCCKGCNMSSKSNSPDFVDNQMRLKYVKHNMYKMELENNPCTSSPKQVFDDNPVTSTFIERNQAINDNCPIQAGTVSTSNVSLTETLQPPEPSPTLSNSSRNTDTPHSSGSNNSQVQPNSTYHMQSPVYSNNGRDNSNPPTPGNNQGFTYNSPGPPSNQSISGTQMMHFISNHNVNKNLMEVDNISMVGVRPGIKSQEMMRMETRRRIENSMPGYCPPPHLGGGPAHSLIQACYVQTFVTTMASGFSVTRDTVTSVLAGKANTATTSINASQANFVRPPPPPSVNLATTYAIPNNQPDPFFNSVNLPTSYPLHIAGTTAQNMISKSPLEMVQNVIGSLPSKSESNSTGSVSQVNRRTTPGQILISSTGQIIVSNNQMPPPPPKTTTTVAPGQSSNVTNVSASVTQVVPPVGGVPSIVNQPTVVVNTLQTPFVIQPPMMAVDGQMVQQNAVLPQIMASGIVSGQSANEPTRQQIDVKSHQSYVQGVAMLSPETMKKRSKKKKGQANITNVLQITAPQQNPNNIMVHSSPQQNSSPQFSPRGFQLSPNNNISPTPMLQALTIVPGKSGAPAHIVMNGQGNTNNFGSQQIITNTSPSQQINLLQPVNLINNASSVMSNFPAFQQFIVPNLGGMVMTADGTAIIQDNSPGMPMQLQLQTVNGQNVLTPVPNSGVFTTGANGGMVIRAQNQQGKIIQSQHSPGAQFLSPNSQMMMNSPNFTGQLSPLLTNLSPTNVTFNAGQPVRAGNVQTQEYIHTNQMGQALVLPLSPKAAATTNRTNSTFVHHNTTIVQQQTTLVSNSHTAPMSSMSGGAGAGAARGAEAAGEEGEGYLSLMRSLGALGPRHSVSTQTRKSPGAAGSPPDTTTHSPLGAEPAASPRRPARADTTTRSPEPPDNTASAMVQCVSSSEQDMADSRDNAWPTRNDFNPESDSQNIMTNLSMMRQRSHHNPVESTEVHYNPTMTTPSSNHNPHVMPMANNYFERTHNYNKRKNDFGDGSTYRSDKIMRTNNYNVIHGGMKESDYDAMTMAPEKQSRHYQASGSAAETSSLPKVFDRHNLGSSDDAKSGEESDSKQAEGRSAGGARALAVGDLVWGPVRGHASWPGALAARAGAGRWRVRWFGAERPPALVHHSLLLTLTEGLEAHHAARTNHRKSRKLNTLLENAIQEAMAELDKKSENRNDGVGGPSAPAADVTSITETPKRHKKMDKNKCKDKNKKKHPVKIAPNPSKAGEGARLRSSR